MKKKIIIALGLSIISTLAIGNSREGSIAVAQEKVIESQMEVTSENYKQELKKYLEKNNLELNTDNVTHVLDSFMEEYNLDKIIINFES